MAVSPARRRSTPALRHAYDGHRWLAAAVLLRAVRDYAVLTGLRKMSSFELSSFERSGHHIISREKKMRLIGEVTDFLTTDSVFHELAQIEPHSLASVLGNPESMRGFIRAGARDRCP